MKRRICAFLMAALLTLLSPCAGYASGVIVINPNMGDDLALGARAEKEFAHIFGVDSFAFEPSANKGRQTFTFVCYFQNLSLDVTEFKDIAGFELIFKEKFKFQPEFLEYRHVIDPKVTCDAYPLDPIVEIYGVWTLEVPDAVTKAVENDLILKAHIGEYEYTLTLI